MAFIPALGAMIASSLAVAGPVTAGTATLFGLGTIAAGAGAVYGLSQMGRDDRESRAVSNNLPISPLPEAPKPEDSLLEAKKQSVERKKQTLLRGGTTRHTDLSSQALSEDNLGIKKLLGQ
jgi:hypothetical protein